MAGSLKQEANSQGARRSLPFLHGGNVYAFAREHGVRPEDVLDFSASINPLGWPRGVTSIYRQALSQTVHYPEPYAETLTAALAQYHGLDPRLFIIGNGSTQLIYLLARVLQPRRVLIISPTFSEHESAFRLAGAQVSHFLLRPPTFALVIEKLQRRLAEGVDTLIVTNPNSPTGTLSSSETVQAIVRVCRRLRIHLLVDEAFVDWGEEASLKTLVPRQPSLIILRSLTKFFAVPGLRIGYVIAQQNQIQRIRKQLEPWAVNNIAQAVATACVNDAQFIRQSRLFMIRERRWFARQLQAMSGFEVFPSAANFFLVRIVKPEMTTVDIAQQLAAANILIRDCSNFAGLGEKFFRVAVRRRTENNRLLSALQEACEKLEKP